MTERVGALKAMRIGRWERWAIAHPVWAAVPPVAGAMVLFSVVGSFAPDASWDLGARFGFVLGLISAGGDHLRLNPRPEDHVVELGVFAAVCAAVVGAVVLGNVLLTAVLTGSSVATTIMSNRRGLRTEAALVAGGWVERREPGR